MKYSEFLHECIKMENNIRAIEHRDLIRNFGDVYIMVDERGLGIAYSVMRFFKNEDELKNTLVEEFVTGMFGDNSKPPGKDKIENITKWINKDEYFKEVKRNFDVFAYSGIDMNKEIDLEEDNPIYRHTLNDLQTEYLYLVEENDKRNNREKDYDDIDKKVKKEWMNRNLER